MNRGWICSICNELQWKGKKGAHNSCTCKKRHKRKFNDAELEEHLLTIETIAETDDSSEMKLFAKTQKEIIEDLMGERDQFKKSVKALQLRAHNRRHYKSVKVAKLTSDLEESRVELEKSKAKLETLEFDNAVLKKKLYVISSTTASEPPQIKSETKSTNESETNSETILKQKIAHLEQCHSEVFVRTVRLRNEKARLEQMIVGESSLRSKFAKEKEEMEKAHMQKYEALNAKLTAAETEIARQRGIIHQLELIDVEAFDHKHKLKLWAN